MKKLTKILKPSFLGIWAAIVLSACGGGSLSYNPSLVIGGGGGGGPQTPTGLTMDSSLAGYYPTVTASTGSCVPAMPTSGQTIQLQTVGLDGQVSGRGFFPVGTANLTYTFGSGSYTASSSDTLSYTPSPYGTFDTSTGAAISDNSPNLPESLLPNGQQDPNNWDSSTNTYKYSFVNFYPSDWAQRLARMLDSQPANGTASASIPVALVGAGKLPGLLASLYGTFTNPNTDLLQEELVATAYRMPDGAPTTPAGGITNACNFNFTITRQYMLANYTIDVNGQHGGPFDPSYNSGNPLVITDDTYINNTVGDYQLMGPDLSGATDSDKLSIEAYIPNFAGTFSTSNQVPFFPVSMFLYHTYGVSSALNSFYSVNEASSPYNGTTVSKALVAQPQVAQQTLTFVSATP